MQTRLYRAGTIKEATGKVRKSLGPDAMIISTRRLSRASGGDLFEISAAPCVKTDCERRSDPFTEVNNQLMSIKDLISLLSRPDCSMDHMVMNPSALRIYAKLIREGVDESLARSILDEALETSPSTLIKTDDVKEKAAERLMNIIDVKNPFETNKSGRTIAAFIGTTGVGKTTTIAKLAARLILNTGKKVGLISIDTYRIGAMEQLKTYAGIMGVPCFKAFKRKDLLFAIRKLESSDVILIDTAGRSQYDKSRIEELKGMLGNGLDISSHLLLSIGTRESEMQKTALSFDPLKYQTYIFTKLDEAQRFGSLINQTAKTGLPVSYVTTGQNVPEDIAPADKRSILRLLLNSKRTNYEGFQIDEQTRCRNSVKAI